LPDFEKFEEHRWHSAEYVQSWIADHDREANRRPMRKKLVSLLPFEHGAAIRVLDIGAGTGGLSLGILKAYPSVDLTCQDYSEIMLGHARRRTMRFSKKISFVISDLGKADWTGAIKGEFDAVVSSLVLHNIRDASRIREIYGEIHSLTKPGGCFLCGDLVAAPGPVTGRVFLKARFAAYKLEIRKRTGIEKSLAG
jgi:ubiquinone/menaquinone biosynthesis C-methylase UbiE